MNVKLLRAARHAVSVARIDLLDLLRVRSTWFALLMFPAINVVLIVILPGVLTQREQARQDTTRYAVAVEGDAADVNALIARVRATGLRLTPSTDVKGDVLSRRAEVGVVLPEGTAAALEGNGQTELRLVVLGTRNESRLATGRVVAEIERLRTSISIDRVEALGLPEAAVRPFLPVAVDLADTERGARLDLGGVIPLLLLLPLSGAIGMAGQRISGAKDQRVLEPLLLLPLSRSTLLAGKAIAGFTLGCVMVPAVGAPLALGRLVPIGGTGQRVAVPVSTLGAIIGMAFALLVLLVALGLFAGAASRTSAELSSILPFVSFPVILLALAMQFFSDIASDLPLLVTPAIGPVLVARDLAAGSASAGDAAIAIGSSFVWASILLATAARLLDRDASVIRPTSA